MASSGKALPEATVSEIRSLFSVGGYSQYQIAEMVGINIRTVRKQLTQEERDRRSERRKRDYENRIAGVVDEWQTGEYNLNQLSQRWEVSRDRIGTMLRRGGESARDTKYRNAVIFRLHKEGRAYDWLSVRFGLTVKTVEKIMGETRPDQQTCPICHGSFAPHFRGQDTCSKRCANYKRNIEKKCIVCDHPYFARSVDQQCCGTSCTAVLFRIRGIERGLRIRALRGAGLLYREIATITGFSVSACQQAVRSTKTTRPVFLEAVEIILRHTGKTWLSGLAKMELRRAWVVLRSEGLERYVRGLQNSGGMAGSA